MRANWDTYSEGYYDFWQNQRVERNWSGAGVRGVSISKAREILPWKLLEVDMRFYCRRKDALQQ